MLGAWHLKGLAHLLVTLVKVQLMSLLPQASKVSFWFNAKISMQGNVWLLLMRSDAKLSKCVRHAEEKRRVIWPWVESWNRAIFWPLCVSFRASKNTDILSHLRCTLCEEIGRNTVRVWESKKEKEKIFFFSQVTRKEGKLVEFLLNFLVL